MLTRHTGLPARVRDWIARHGAPVSSARLMETFLRMGALPEDQATRLLAPSLQGAGLGYEPGAGWRIAAEPVPEETIQVAAVPDPETGRVALAAPDARGGWRDVELTGLEGPLARGGVSFVVRDRADIPAMKAWLLGRGGPAAPMLTWRTALRGRVRISRAATLESLAALLGLRWHDGESARSTARILAACLQHAGAMNAARAAAAGSGDEDDAGGGASPPAGATSAGAAGQPQAAPCRIPREQIDALPNAPGTYRFYADDGTVLYVGKARDLRVRVASYFRPGRRGGHGSRFLPEAVRLEHTVEGSELEALLREARLLARHVPRGNVQFAVHERGRRYGAARAWALLLPRAGGGGTTAVIVRDGRYVGHLRLGPRGGGVPAARRLLDRAIGSRPPAARAPAAPAADRDTGILMSWLARHGDDVSRVDLDSFRTASAALRALADAARAVRLDPGRTIVRGAPARRGGRTRRGNETGGGSHESP